ncbi:response regulator [Marinobacter sp. SBS5]|uniref:response regulator n=1 Tax=Marinobacter sp. SBS5 TaxID=3401754 RepID=UPI003AABBF3B
MASLKALVVDDASFVRDLIKRTVRQRFPMIETTDAQNGRRAQSLMSRTTFDLVLCDWEMPEMSGLELLQWMRQQPQYQNVPFIMITSRGDKGHVVEAVKEGVSEYLGKPFSPEGLSKKIVKVMGSRLQAAGSQKISASSSPAGAFSESADLLTQKRQVSETAQSDSLAAPSKQNPLLSASQGASTDRKPASRAANVAAVRFSESTLKSVVKDISLTEVRVIAKRDQDFPGILDQAVVDIDIGEGNVARLNGYVHQLQAVDKRQDTDFVSVTIRFVDEDPKKMEDLSRFVARFRAGAG